MINENLTFVKISAKVTRLSRDVYIYKKD